MKEFLTLNCVAKIRMMTCTSNLAFFYLFQLREKPPPGFSHSRRARELPELSENYLVSLISKANRDLIGTVRRATVYNTVSWRHVDAEPRLEVAPSVSQSDHLLREIRTVHARSFTWEHFIVVIAAPVSCWKDQTYAMYTFLNITVEQGE